MKFTINHYYRFDNWKTAFLAGFLQATSILVIEFVNFIVIMTSSSFLTVVMNFMALAIISEFDNAFYAGLGDDKNKRCLEEPEFEDLFKITVTSSSNGQAKNKLNRIRDDTLDLCDHPKPQYIGVVYTPERYFFRIVYKSFRLLQCAVWFYFLPFIALIGSYLMPYYIKKSYSVV